MALWFAHLEFADRAARHAALDRHELAWGALCCDVDKFTPVERDVSHYGTEGLDFPPEEWGPRTGLDAASLRSRRAFLAGYLSHMALDEAWYGWLRGRLASVHTGGWTRDTTKAWNLAMDLELRPGLRLGLNFPFGTEEVLKHLRGFPGQMMQQAAGAYTAWDGSLEAEGLHPLMQGYARSMHGLAEAEQERVTRLMEASSTEELHARCEDFVNDAVARFLASIPL